MLCCSRSHGIRVCARNGSGRPPAARRARHTCCKRPSAPIVWHCSPAVRLVMDKRGGVRARPTCGGLAELWASPPPRVCSSVVRSGDRTICQWSAHPQLCCAATEHASTCQPPQYSCTQRPRAIHLRTPMHAHTMWLSTLQWQGAHRHRCIQRHGVHITPWLVLVARCRHRLMPTNNPPQGYPCRWLCRTMLHPH